MKEERKMCFTQVLSNLTDKKIFCGLFSTDNIANLFNHSSAIVPCNCYIYNPNVKSFFIFFCLHKMYLTGKRRRVWPHYVYIPWQSGALVTSTLLTTGLVPPVVHAKHSFGGTHLFVYSFRIRSANLPNSIRDFLFLFLCQTSPP